MNRNPAENTGIDTGSLIFLVLVSLVAALGGFLFGYDTAVISGTISFVTKQFSLDVVWEGWFVSSALVGCIAGVSVAGILSDRFGRKRMLLASALLFSLSALGCTFAQTYALLVFYRFIGGLGVGITSMLSPLYISEISPPHLRGRLVTLYQFAITIGILTAYFTNALILNLSEKMMDVLQTGVLDHIIRDEVWRGMFGSETIPALVFFILVLAIPESPRWLTTKERPDKAEVVLTRIAGIEIARKEIREIQETISLEKRSFKQLLKPGFRLALFIGVVLAILSQFSGINAIIYYGPRILEDAGFQISDALGGQVIIGMVNVIFTVIAIWKIDKLGRRKLLIFGASGAMVSHIVIGSLFALNITEGFWLMTFILIFIACFAFSFGPVIWVILAEIYPTRIRGTAMSIATLSLWVGTAIIGQTVPWLLENITPAGTFWVFAVLCFPTIYVAWKILPETKGKSLEEIEREWKRQNLP